MKVSFIIPSFNEERTIDECLTSVIKQKRPPEEIIIVNDGSTDKTKIAVARFNVKNVKLINLEKNTGNKAKAMEVGLKHATGEIIAMTDADTFVDPNFLAKILPHFKDKRVGVVAGKVLSKKSNLLTAARQLEYIMAHEIHKSGQAALGSIFVVPGCAAAFRREVLDEVGLDHDTVTEDLDITLKMHKRGYKIVYEPHAKVYTSDPFKITSYIKQINRWYSGTFQNLKKHKDIIGKGFIGKIEIPMTLIESFIFGAFYLLAPLLFFWDPKLVLFIMTADFLIIALVALYGVYSLKRYDLIFSIPVHYLLRIVNLIVWYFAFFKEIVFKKKDLRWHRAKK